MVSKKPTLVTKQPTLVAKQPTLVAKQPTLVESEVKLSPMFDITFREEYRKSYNAQKRLSKYKSELTQIRDASKERFIKSIDDNETGVNEEFNLVKCLTNSDDDGITQEQIKDIVFNINDARCTGNELIECFKLGKNICMFCLCRCKV